MQSQISSKQSYSSVECVRGVKREAIPDMIFKIICKRGEAESEATPELHQARAPETTVTLSIRHVYVPAALCETATHLQCICMDASVCCLGATECVRVCPSTVGEITFAFFCQLNSLTI